MAAGRVLDALQVAVRDRYGVEVRADDVTLSLRNGTAVFKGFRILDGPATVLESERVEVDLRVLDVLRRRFDFAKVVVLRPVIRVVLEEEGRTNLRRILGTPRRGPPGPRDVLILRTGTLEDGRVEFTDALTDPAKPFRGVVGRLRGTISEWQIAGDPATPSFADLRVDGEIEQAGFPARISVAAWRSPPGGPENQTLLAVVTGFDLRGIPQYVGAADRAAVGGDFLHVAVDVRSRDGIIGPGNVLGEVAGTGTLLPLLVGGTTSDPVFDRESPLAMLLRLPLSRVFHLGEVTLGAGWSVVEGGAGAVADVGGGVLDAGLSLGTGIVNAGGEALSGNPLGVLEEAGGGVLGVATSLGGGLIDGVVSLFGGGAGAVEAIAGEDADALEKRFGARHEKGRLAMLRAALDSAGGSGALDRHARIAAEIAGAAAAP